MGGGENIALKTEWGWRLPFSLEWSEIVPKLPNNICLTPHPVKEELKDKFGEKKLERLTTIRKIK